MGSTSVTMTRAPMETTTGCRDILVGRHFEAMRNDAIVCSKFYSNQNIGRNPGRQPGGR
jgi:S-adenosylhomocysteine hydrolase